MSTRSPPLVTSGHRPLSSHRPLSNVKSGAVGVLPKLTVETSGSGASTSSNASRLSLHSPSNSNTKTFTLNNSQKAPVQGMYHPSTSSSTSPPPSFSPQTHNSTLISYHSQPGPDRALPSLQVNENRRFSVESPSLKPGGAVSPPPLPSPTGITSHSFTHAMPSHIRTGSLIRSSRASSRASSPERERAEQQLQQQRLLDLSADNQFEALDDQLLKSTAFSELFRIVRMCGAQGSCERMVSVLERQVRYLVTASAARVVLVQKDGLVHQKGITNNINAGIIGYARNKREIVNIVMPAQDDRFSAEIDTVGDRAPLSLLCVPIEADNRADCSGSKDVVALFQVVRDQPEPFLPRECKLLYRLGEFVGNMLRNSRSADRAHALYNASLQSQRRSAALLDVAKALASETRLESIVGIIVSQVPELLDSDRCTLFFVDREREQLIVTKGSSKGRQSTLVSWIFGQSNAPELPFPKGQNEIRFSIHNGVAGHVAMTGETVNIADAHQDPRFNANMDKETGYRTRSMLCVPMMDSNGVIIGVVQAINKNPLFPRFDSQDETLLKTFSAQAALAVRNSQLIHKTTTALKHSDALLQVTKALSQELKIEALIQIICSKVQDLLHSERCTVFIVDKERKELYTSEHMSFGMGPALPIDREKATLIYFPMDRGIAGSVASTGKTVNIPDAYLDSRFNQTFDKQTGFRTRSILCVAIMDSRNEVAGVLQAVNKQAKKGEEGLAHFGEEDEKLLEAFCAQAAVAIENSRLFQQTERALNHALAEQRNMKFMLSVTKNLFSDMHLTSMIDQMTMQVHHLLKADDCAVYLVDSDRKEFWLAKEDQQIQQQSTSGTELSQAKRFPFTLGIVGHVASTGETVRISSAAHNDPRFSPQVDQRKGKTTHSILCSPVVATLADNQSRIVGVISVRDEKDRGGFEQEEEKLLKVFCAQAAVAIMNSKRFNSIMEQNEAKSGDRSAADYLKETRGMKLASDDINTFQFKMDDIKIKGAIGTGSYGEVYKAVVNGQIVAVKKLHVKSLKAEQVDAFCKEASLMCQLDHPNIVGFIGAVTEPQNLCIITQYCSRGSLADLLLDDKIWMNFRIKVKFALDSALGMYYLHKSNPAILHRDLKSDNLLVTEDWTIKVADFGLTRFISEKKQMTQVGTPMWMAPEIIMGKKYTEKADVYAFGIILWEILTRLEPYEEKEPMQIVVEVVNDGLRPTLPAECADSPLVPLMKDCWQTDPEKRPPFEKIVARLQAIQKAIPPDDNSPAGVPHTSIQKPQAGTTLVAGEVTAQAK